MENGGATAGKPLTFETKQQEHGSRKKAVREKQLQMACIIDGMVEVGAVAVRLDVSRCRSQGISEYRYCPEQTTNHIHGNTVTKICPI